MSWCPYMKQRQGIMSGKPLIKGTPLTIEWVLKRRGDGDTEVELLDIYPKLQPEHIRSAQAFAAVSLPSEMILCGY